MGLPLPAQLRHMAARLRRNGFPTKADLSEGENVLIPKLLPSGSAFDQPAWLPLACNFGL
jgi:hypothetical protein